MCDCLPWACIVQSVDDGVERRDVFDPCPDYCDLYADWLLEHIDELFPPLNYTIQSTDMPVDQGEGNDQTQQNVEFIETTAGSSVGLISRDDVTLYDRTPGVGLGEYLSRPTRILSATWSETDPSDNFVNFNPWYGFFNNSRIKKKVDNYSWIKCNLHVKFTLSASPFYYGAMLVSYRPLIALNSDTAATSAANSEWVPRSQRPHIWLYPQENKAGELTLPFFYHKNWLDLKSAADLQNMGEITMDVVSILRSANGATGVGVTIQAYAWATEVELCGPTLGLAVQSADEYGTGPISTPASAVANAAGSLKKIPAIAKFATATQIGAKAVGKIASMFGYTNVPVISDSQPMRPSAFPQLASAEVGFPSEKLTLDPKNELTIDPSALGLPSVDELSIEHLVQRESFLISTTWSTSDTVDQQLFYSAVSPWMFRDDVTAQQHKIQMPPCAWVANLFENWRGDVIFRFRFIRSKYHKGRVKISFDPSGQVTNNLIEIPESSNAIFTKIVDIAEEDNVEVRIPYKQAVAFLRTNTSFTNDVWKRRATDVAGNFIYNPNDHNGMITVRVLNVLTAPIASSTIEMLISVRGAENLEFANPCHVGEFSPYEIQSQDEYEDESVLIETGPVTPVCDSLYLLHYGETMKSLRQLLRRHSLNEVWAEPNDTASAFYVSKHTMTRFPIPYGFDTAGGIHSANKVLTAGTANFNFTFSTPLNWIMPAFVALRGSMNWTFNVSLPSNYGPVATHVRVIRRPNVSADAGRTSEVAAAKTTTSASASFFRGAFDSGQGGNALTHQGTNSGLSVTLPNCNRYKFQSTSPQKTTVTSSIDGSDRDTSRLEVYTTPLYGATTRGLVIEKYCGIGTDFNLYWFLNVPTTYFYITAITPN